MSKIFLELMADLIPDNIVDECKAFDTDNGSDGNLWKVRQILHIFLFIIFILDLQASGCGPLRRGGRLLDWNTLQHLPLKRKGQSKIRAFRFIWTFVNRMLKVTWYSMYFIAFMMSVKTRYKILYNQWLHVSKAKQGKIRQSKAK